MCTINRIFILKKADIDIKEIEKYVAIKWYKKIIIKKAIISQKILLSHVFWFFNYNYFCS